MTDGLPEVLDILRGKEGMTFRIGNELRSRGHGTYKGVATAYVRRTTHLIDGQWVKAFTMASVTVDEKQRGQGVFTCLMREIEALAAEEGRAVYVESVLNDRLWSWLLSQEYQPVNGGWGRHCLKTFPT